MLKRTIALFLMFLASTVWLAHDILPHHHHNALACMEAEHCQHDKDNQAHAQESGSHQHDTNTASYCVLDQLAIVPPPNFRSNNGFPEPLQLDTDLDLIQAVVAFTHSIVFISPKPLALFTNSVSTTLYSVFICQSLGLRAPPTV